MLNKRILIFPTKPLSNLHFSVRLTNIYDVFMYLQLEFQGRKRVTESQYYIILLRSVVQLLSPSCISINRAQLIMSTTLRFQLSPRDPCPIIYSSVPPFVKLYTVTQKQNIIPREKSLFTWQKIRIGTFAKPF